MELLLFLVGAFILAAVIGLVLGVSIVRALVIGIIGLIAFYVGHLVLSGLFAAVVGGVSVIGGLIIFVAAVILAIVVVKKLA